MTRPQPRSQDQLVNVRQLSATDAAFSALLADGKVVTWGADGDGGKSENLEKVQEMVGMVHDTSKTSIEITGCDYCLCLAGRIYREMT